MSELTEEEKAEIAKCEANKEKHHRMYLKRNTFGIPVQAYDEEHFTTESLVFAGSAKADS